jgi:hypothetical protein
VVYLAGATSNAYCADVTVAGTLAAGSGQTLGARDVAVASDVERLLFRRTNERERVDSAIFASRFDRL